MAGRHIIDQLDDAVTALLARHEPVVSETDGELSELVTVARKLRGLPSEQFRAMLKEQRSVWKEFAAAINLLTGVDHA